ncbi:hypothetical protein BU24DRAFT_419090 [Aaosphaeria arxii CBS 175.79]|uniref:Extracellular mutant protein 11 C-terminal domain-containing protein n=1 Tax=Aaosphaeria arxii CBS 175.79 TaxID=1450172 RepID=A0A6A5Y1V5_9PLEO|nr:uncharacterized protein BU24DRAFT_419090 [Aaosphaeria arxii CBS 175.79]KAF2019478.1 hypothetical protein BU24DRAFT_419090 [Aaosphaeria arxii CBS 175.79]
MQQFVHGKQGDGASKASSRNASRRRMGENAKIPVTTRLENAQQAASRSNSRSSHHSRQLDRGPMAYNAPDPYGTDAESIDTTLPGASMVQVLDSQRTDPAKPGPDSTSEADSGDDSGDEGADAYEFNEVEQQLLSDAGMHDASFEEQWEYVREQQRHPDRYGSPYPTTTSGRPGSSDDFEGVHEYDEPDNHANASTSPPLPVPQDRNTEVIHPHPARRSHRSPTPTRTPNIRDPTQLYIQAAGIRKLKASANNAVVTPRYHQEGVRELSINPHSQPGQSGTFPEPVMASGQHRNTHIQMIASNGNLHNEDAHLRREIPLLSAEQRLPSQNTKATELPIPRSTTPYQYYDTGKEDRIETQQKPVEDYDLKDLFQMDYEQLSKEDFDTNPRADAPVLSENMQQKPLAERLQYVQKNLDLKKQSEFFTGLPTNEWEDAGDWFLEQFTNIIQRTKEARQTKRKFARKLEDEIEERHKHVAKKQQIVKAAMDSMKSKGNQLIPNSPRRSKSKSPAPKRH